MRVTLSKWRFGLRVAILYGLCTGLAAGFVVSTATWREVCVVILINLGGQVAAYIQKHPADDVHVPEDPQQPQTPSKP